MRKNGFAALLLALILLLAGCGETVYAPTGEKTGNKELDDAVLEVIEEICSKSAAAEENLRAVYGWVRDEIDYRAAKGDGAAEFTDAVIADLAAGAMAKRKGDCDSEAALMAVFLRRMGCKADVVKGQFLRGEDGAWVDHAWVVAVIEGVEYHFDPLYDRYFAQKGGTDCFMARQEQIEKTHIR